MYDKELIGNIVNIKGLRFINTDTQKYEMDHAYKNGRPCLLIYSDDKYDYFLSLTSNKKRSKYKNEYYQLSNDSYKYLYKYPFYGSWKEKPTIGFANVKCVFKMPICGYGFGEIGKIKFSEYKNIINLFKEYHKVDDINEILENAISIRK